MADDPQDLLRLAGRIEDDAVAELFSRTRPGVGETNLEWEEAKGIAALFACADGLRARAHSTKDTSNVG